MVKTVVMNGDTRHIVVAIGLLPTYRRSHRLNSDAFIVGEILLVSLINLIFAMVYLGNINSNLRLSYRTSQPALSANVL
jgi:hypothetical protein